MKQETLNERLDRIELEIKSLSDISINRKQVLKLFTEVSMQVKSIKPGISDQVKSMLADLKPDLLKSCVSERKLKSVLDKLKSEAPKPGISKKDVDSAIQRGVTKELINGLYRNK